MRLEHKTFKLELKSVDEAEGKAEFIAGVFNNIDRQKDVIVPGAFTKTLQTRSPKFVADHDWTVRSKLGKVTVASETPEGLLTSVQFNLNKQLARETFSDLAFDPEGAEFSIGYVAVDEEHKDGIRYLKEVDLYEVSVVLIGMNPKTRLVGVKGDLVIAEEEIVPEGDEQEQPDPALSEARKQLDELLERLVIS